MKKKFISILAIFVFVFPSLVFAKENIKKNKTRYTFVKGNKIPICEDYYKNINSFNPREIACAREFKPALKDFKETDWERLNLAKRNNRVRS